MIVIWSLFAALAVYQAVDVWQTYLLVELGASETNPLILWLSAYFGFVPAMILIKCFWLSIIGVLLIFYQRRKYE